MSLPERGPWLVTATSSSVDWVVAATALAATSGGRAAVVIVGAGPDLPSAHLLRAHVATLVAVEGEHLSLDDVAAIVRALSGTHIRVLAVASDGLVTPLGDGGWTAADLAAEVHAPVAVITGTGADAVGHAILMLEALETRRIPASVIAVGDGGDFSALPVRLAGQIPADALEHRDRFAEAAREWVHPLTGMADPATSAGNEADKPVETAPAKPDLQTRIAKKAALGLAVALVVALVVLFLCNGVGMSAFTMREAELHTPPPAQPSVHVQPPVPRRSPERACPPSRFGPTAAAQDPTAGARVEAAWTRIERWLAAKAPVSYASLRGPAAPQRIAAAQAGMSVAFPPDLVASLRRHDGVEAAAAFTLPPFHRPLPLAQIVATWTVNCRVLADLAPGPDWWDKGFVPFAADGGGGCLLADQRPGHHGRVGEFDPETGARFERWPASTAELLEDVADALETGSPFDGRYQPTVTAAGELDWTILRTPR
ncbi:SMI1/KNR4 family protein [Dactylosporangium sp. NPDC000555]|uniref:SMI1/KNR4 family protein n=1 Tax=Dactylosporangium sp. NPDC000555 TaxID=3154260 RepID=UPI00332BCA04